MEIWRRGVLLACVCLAMWAAKFAVLKPLMSVRTVDFAEKQKGETRWTDEGKRLAALSLEDYVADKTKGVRLQVSGHDWERFFMAARAASGGKPPDRSWARRIPADERHYGFTDETVFFRPGEPPVREIAGRFKADNDRAYLVLEAAGVPAYLEITYHIYSSDDFHFGSGFSRMPKPPAAFLYPYRRTSLWILIVGLGAYLLLPRRKKSPNAIEYAAWRNILGDFASFLLIVPFFFLPLLIVGGSVQALTQGWMLCLVLWPLGMMGVWLLRTMAWYAGYRILLEDAGLILESGGLSVPVRYADIIASRPLVLMPPRWLVRLSFLAAMSGRGAARVGAAGRAFLLAGSEYGGLGLTLKDKSEVYIWVTDAMGSSALKNAKGLVKRLAAAGIPVAKEPETLRSVAVPTGRDTSGRLLKQGSERLLGILAFVPIAVMLVFFLIVLFGHPY